MSQHLSSSNDGTSTDVLPLIPVLSVASWKAFARMASSGAGLYREDHRLQGHFPRLRGKIAVAFACRQMLAWVDD